ncbi:hypothetical protein [Pseudoxanthomonas suwonensis]|uniref:SMODS and SLOG-associating 2TM effector domain-containing protein n=1 Tax=Pseudoxanthomonas suwonensis TaxID=314722 RepID=A0A0E3UPD3_9GAMM|nr:hypothetical protein [Pseudoxanthomonas suwonensis]AKC87961.1 hypothetical protein WQ53_15500 [Pseudoxanthomonas suwonensis]
MTRADTQEAPLLAHSLVVGVTGHRKLRDTDLPALQSRVSSFLQELQARYPRLPVVLLSSLAEGSDQLAAQAALDLGIRVVAPLPLPERMYREDFEDPQALDGFGQQLRQVEAIELPLEQGVWPEDVARPGPARDRQYARSGVFVSSHCHVLLALWDGKESGSTGGTAQVVRYHLHGTLGGAVERRYSADTLLGPDRESVVYHLPTARQGDTDTPPLPGRWLTAEDEIVSSYADPPPAFARMFARQSAFNVDRDKYAAEIAAQHEASPGARRCPIWRTFSAADWLARTCQRRVARVLWITYVLVALMGFTFFTYTHVISHDVVIYAFLTIFLVGFGVATLASRRQWQRKYLDYRTLAEGLRVQSYWRRAGLVQPGAPAFVHDNFLQKQDVELGWIRNVMRGASLDGMRVQVADDVAEVDAVIREWIGSAQSGGQLGYYSAASLRRERQHRRAETLGLVCITLGVGMSVVLALFARQFDDHLKHILVSVMGILSVAAAVHEAYMHKKADKELARQFRFMQRIFASARRLLDGARDKAEKRRILAALGEAALTEHAEWSLMHRDRPLPTSRI